MPYETKQYLSRTVLTIAPPCRLIPYTVAQFEELFIVLWMNTAKSGKNIDFFYVLCLCRQKKKVNLNFGKYYKREKHDQTKSTSDKILRFWSKQEGSYIFLLPAVASADVKNLPTSLHVLEKCINIFFFTQESEKWKKSSSTSNSTEVLPMYLLSEKVSTTQLQSAS